MLQSLQNTHPNFTQQILRRIIPIVIVVFILYSLVIGLFVYNANVEELASSHSQTNTTLQAQLFSELSTLLRSNQDVANAGQLRSQAEALLANDQVINDSINQLFADLIRLNPNQYLTIQYIASNGVILNEVLNERGIPIVQGADILPRLDTGIVQSTAFQNSLQSLDSEDFYLSNFSLITDEVGDPIVPLQATFSVYIPIFDLVNPRTPLGTVRFVVSADTLLQVVKNPLLSGSENQSLFLFDNQGNIIADSSAQSQEYLLRLVGLEPSENIEGLSNDVVDFVTPLTENEITAVTNEGAFYTIREFHTGDSQNTVWKLVIVEPQNTIWIQLATTMFFIVLVSVAVVALMIYLIQQQVHPVLEPILNVNHQAQQFANQYVEGDTGEWAIPDGSAQEDTLPISSALVTLSQRIQDLTSDISEQSTRHNRDMQIITNIGRETATLYDIDTLMLRSIELICNELGFYHAQIFLVDEVQVNAVLVHSRGEAGLKLLEQDHKLGVGSDSIIGRVTSKGIPVIVNDTLSGETVHGFNPLLPDTRAEMALPLIIGDEVIGALDVQSVEPNVFHQEDLPTFQLIADQLAVAIHNAQLRKQSDQRIAQINRLNRQLTRDSWTEAQSALEFDFNYTYDLMGVNQVERIDETEGGLVAPITIRGEVIGTLNATPPEGVEFSEGDQAILRAVAERVALAIENARLFQETQVVLSETEVLYELSRRLSEIESYNDIIDAVIEVVAPDAHGGEIWIFDEYNVGERPDWAQLVTTRPFEYSDDEGQADSRIYLPQHPIFNQLTGSTVVSIQNVATHPEMDDNFRQLAETINAQSIIFVPLNMRGQWNGFFTIYFDKPHVYNDREKRVYNALVDQAGVAIDNRLLLEQTEMALERSAKLYTSSRIINTSQNLSELVYAAVVTTGNAQLDFWLGLLEEVQVNQAWDGQLRIVAHSEMGQVVETDEVHTIHIPSTSSIIRHEPEILTDSQTTWLWDTNHAFVSAFPLISDNQPIAIFFIVSYEDYQLTDEDYEVYRALTGQMSTQIQNSRLLEQSEQALAETQRLYIASRAIAGATDIDSIFESAAGHLAMPFLQSSGTEQVIISMIASHPNPVRHAPYMQYRYQWRSDTNMMFEVPTGSVVPAKEVPFAELFDSRITAQYYPDIELDLTDSPILQKVLQQDGGKSAVVTVLQTRQNWYGVLICKSNQVDAFDQRYVEFMQAVANQFAIGIENQLLFDSAQAEQQRLQTILSTLPTGVMVLDPNTYVPILVNDNVPQLLGRDISMNEPFSPQMYHLYRTGTDNLYPEDELPIFMATASGENETVDDIALMDNDYRIDLLLSAAPIFDDEGKQTAIVAAFQDIRNLRSLEQTLQENLRSTIASYETQRSLSQALTLDELLDTILGQLYSIPSDDVLIMLTDDQRGEPIPVRQLQGDIDDIRGLDSVLKDELIHISNIQSYADASPEAKSVFEQLHAQSALVLPMNVASRESTLGWIMLLGVEADHFTSADERALVALGDMARTEIENRYLVQSTQTALQETRTLYTATTMITRASDFVELGEAIQQAIQSLQPDMCAGFITVSPNHTIEMFNSGFDASVANGMDMEVLQLVELPDGESDIYISDIEHAPPGDIEVELRKGKDIVAFAAINLRAKDMQNGRILMGFHKKRNFTEGDIRYLNSLADSASVVIDNQALLQQIQSTLQETSVLYQSSRALNDATSPSEIIDVVINYLIAPHVNQVFVAVLNKRSWDLPGATVEIEAGWQADGGVNLEGVTLSEDQFPAWKQLSHPAVLMIDDIYDESIDIDFMERTSIESLDTRSLVIIPLRVYNRAIGSVWIGSREPYAYTDTDARIFQSFAESASLSLEASYLLEQTEHRARQLETSSQVGQSVSQILDLNVLLPQVVELIREQFDYDHVQVFLMDENDEYAVLEASTGESGRQLLAMNHKLAKGSNSVIGEVTATGEPSIALDTADANVVHQPNQVLPLTRSEMALPLIVKGQVAGALDVQSNQPNAFGEDDIRALTTLAGQIAVAIDNANLYEEIGRRASDMSLLFDTTVLATSSDNLENALQAVTDNLHDSLNASAVVFYLPQQFINYVVLKAVAMSGSDQPLSEISDVTVGDSENLIGVSAETMRHKLIPNIGDEARYLSIVPSSSTTMLVPISTGGKLIGLIAVEHNRVNAFSQDDLQLVVTLAGSLSAIVENSQLLDELQKTNEQLREVDRLKSQFLANMSHELRTPLNSIIGFSRVMLKGIDGALTEMQEQDLTTIYNSGNHLLNLINDILDQAKIESGKMDLKFAYFGVKTLIESVKSIGIGLVKEKSVDLVIDLESGLPEAYGDEFRTRQILLNLVSNAAKFTSEGTITIRAYIVVDEHTNTKFIRIDVVDTGIGIDEKDIHLLFETFRQVDSSLTRTVGGTGLGLPLSKSLAEMQGGELLVESEVGIGSIFTVTIPTEEVMAENPEDNPEDATEPDAPIGVDDTDAPVIRPTVTTQAVQQDTNLTPPPQKLDKRVVTQTVKQTTKREILLIEDNKDMVDQYRRLLQREGFEVQTADHAMYAEAMVSNLRPTVLIMDVNFADGEGWNILERLKQRDDTFDIPIVVCSVHTDSERAYQLGAHAYIQRPFTNEQIVETVLDAEKESQRERILIIDDQPESVRLLQELLNEDGNYRIFSADNGTEGIALVARRQPDLIILDLRMPEMDGFDVLNELRSNPETAVIPVMIVTGEVDFSADEQAQLSNVHILHKSDLSEEEYDDFINDIRRHLDGEA